MRKLFTIACFVASALLMPLITAPPSGVTFEPPGSSFERNHTEFNWQVQAATPSDAFQVAAVDYAAQDAIIVAETTALLAMLAFVAQRQARQDLEEMRAQMRWRMAREHPPYLTQTA